MTLRTDRRRDILQWGRPRSLCNHRFQLLPLLHPFYPNSLNLPRHRSWRSVSLEAGDRLPSGNRRRRHSRECSTRIAHLNLISRPTISPNIDPINTTLVTGQ